MYKLLIVDDETVVRTSLATMLKWEKLGFTIVGSAPTGKAALNIAQTLDVDLVFTDIKMPVMDGITLLEQLNLLPNPPLTVVLSGYNDFDLVRKAFKLGAVDYVVKGDISDTQLEELVLGLLPRLAAGRAEVPAPQKLGRLPEEKLHDLILGVSEPNAEFLSGSYCLACFEIDDFRSESLRFGNDLKLELIKPMLTFASQVPRVALKCVITSVSASRYLLYYSGEEKAVASDMTSICAQLQKVWKSYLNLSVTAGISHVASKPTQFLSCLQRAYDCVTLKFIFGRGGVFSPAVEALFSVRMAQEQTEKYAPLVAALKNLNSAALHEQQQAFCAQIHTGTPEQAQTMALQMAYHIAIMVADAGSDLWEIFNTEGETDFYQNVSRLTTIAEIERWFINFTRWVVEYLDNLHTFTQMDLMEKAKRFIVDNYTDSLLSLAAVASYVGLNEKYFSTRFHKETGIGFSAYLTEVRISMAKRLILKTDLKMYEVSEAVGYSSVEHFTRVFKKITGSSPNTIKNILQESD